jgi:hypothetical protein
LIADDLTEAELEGRRQVQHYASFFREHLIGCENSFVNDTGVQVGVRQSRQIAGLCTLTNDAVVKSRKHPDGIAHSPWPIELHSGSKPQLHWILEDYYDIPYGCFVPKKGENILATGRCLSAEHEAMASARVTAQCFSYGQAIGLAAAIAVMEKVRPRQLFGAHIREKLNKAGAALDF